MLAFRVVGNPRGKGRPRFSTSNGRPRVYTDPKTVAYEKYIASIAITQARLHQVSGPFKCCIVDITCVFRRPKRLCRRKDPDGRIICSTARVDLDNVEKAVNDGLQRSGLIEDDRNIVKSISRKMYGRKSHGATGVSVELPCIEIRITDDLGCFDDDRPLVSLEVSNA